MTRGGTGANVEIDVNKVIELLIVIMTTINFFIARHNSGRITGLHDRMDEADEKAQNGAKTADKGSV